MLTDTSPLRKQHGGILKLFLCSCLGNVMLGTYHKETIQQHHTALVLELLSVAHLQEPKRQCQHSTADGSFNTVCNINTVACHHHYSSYGATQKSDIKGGNYTHMLVTIEKHGRVHVQGSGKQQQLKFLSFVFSSVS